MLIWGGYRSIHKPFYSKRTDGNPDNIANCQSVAVWCSNTITLFEIISELFVVRFSPSFFFLGKKRWGWKWKYLQHKKGRQEYLFFYFQMQTLYFMGQLFPHYFFLCNDCKKVNIPGEIKFSFIQWHFSLWLHTGYLKHFYISLISWAWSFFIVDLHYLLKRLYYTISISRILYSF